MKVLIVNYSDIDGGAARAAYRLHQSLLAQNIDSQMLVERKHGDDYTVLETSKTKVDKVLNMLRPLIDSIPVRFYKERTGTIFSPAWFGSSNIINIINKINPDIVHLHWINGGMIKISDLERINASVVWSLHDMWAFTGGCHYDIECGGYKEGCGNCKVLGSSTRNDLSKRVYDKKQKIYSKMNNITINGLSNWLHECSKGSTLLQDKRQVNLPNPINTNMFKPFDKVQSRELLNLPKNKKLILFGAIGAKSDLRKGYIELEDALQKLNVDNTEFVIFGSSEPKLSQHFKFKTHYLGRIHDDISLVALYNSVDLMIVPSLQENLSNVIMESLACGTPVVGFDIGGNCDMVEHKNNGYLAQPYDTMDLAKGIEWGLNHPNYDTLCQNARKKAVKTFDSDIVGKRYIDLYSEILEA